MNDILTTRYKDVHLSHFVQATDVWDWSCSNFCSQRSHETKLFDMDGQELRTFAPDSELA
jgi:hypothetical protein